jgi:hypothetical protein
VKFGVSNYAASKAFFVKALEPLGVAAGSRAFVIGPDGHNIEVVCHGPEG